MSDLDLDVRFAWIILQPEKLSRTGSFFLSGSNDKCTPLLQIWFFILSSAFLLLLSPAVILSSYHSVILPFCHRVILSSYHSVILSSCLSVIIPFCHPVILSSYHSVILPFCHPAILSSFPPALYRGLLSSCHLRKNLILLCLALDKCEILLTNVSYSI